MTERAYIPGSAACGQWETLLTDALDGLLRPEDEATFTAHMASCTACSALFDEARQHAPLDQHLVGLPPQDRLGMEGHFFHGVGSLWRTLVTCARTAGSDSKTVRLWRRVMTGSSPAVARFTGVTQL